MRPNHLFGSHFLLSCQISYCSNTYYTASQKRNLNAIYRCPIRYNSVYLEPCVIKLLVRKPFVAVNGQTGVQYRSARFAYVSLLPPSGALPLHLPVPASAPWNRAASGHFSAPARTGTLPAPAQAPAAPVLISGRSEILPRQPFLPERFLLHSMCVFRCICRV